MPLGGGVCRRRSAPRWVLGWLTMQTLTETSRVGLCQSQNPLQHVHEDNHLVAKTEK